MDKGACSVTLKDAADDPVLEPAPGELRLWPEVIVIGLYEKVSQQQTLVSSIQEALSPHRHHLSAETIEDQNWSRAWMDNYKPMRFGQRLWICPHHIDPPDQKAINLRLDPGLAFGTGTHPTTALCLQWLDQHCGPRTKLLDFGCGSGILAIAALMLGATEAHGVDIDNQALEASALNAETNRVAEYLQLYTPQEFEKSHASNFDTTESVETYDVVMANILSGPLIELAPRLARHTRATGDIVLSGILLDQASLVAEAYSRYFDLLPLVEKDGWVLIHGKKLQL